MTLDSNWFYSSIAQCSAAIIALLGAIIATKLQSQLVETETVYRSLKTSFFDFSKQITSAIENTHQDSQTHLLELKKHLNIKNIRDVKTIENNLLDLKKVVPNEHFGHLQGCLNMVAGIDETNAICISKSNLNLPLTFTIVLFWFSLFGLIIPLNYLSAQQDCSKLWILFTFSIGILAFVLYLSNEIRKIFLIRRISF